MFEALCYKLVQNVLTIIVMMKYSIVKMVQKSSSNDDSKKGVTHSTFSSSHTHNTNHPYHRMKHWCCNRPLSATRYVTHPYPPHPSSRPSTPTHLTCQYIRPPPSPPPTHHHEPLIMIPPELTNVITLIHLPSKHRYFIMRVDDDTPLRAVVQVTTTSNSHPKPQSYNNDNSNYDTFTPFF